MIPNEILEYVDLLNSDEYCREAYLMQMENKIYQEPTTTDILRSAIKRYLRINFTSTAGALIARLHKKLRNEIL